MITFAGGHQVLTYADRGVGLIICPDPAGDRAYPGATSMHAQEWTTVMRRLEASGWEVVRNENGHGRQLIGTTWDGRAAYALRLNAVPVLEEQQLQTAWLELCESAGVTPAA